MPELFYKELSYKINGLLFKVHNELGRFCRERQYSDALEKLLKAEGINFVREESISMEMVDNRNTNKADFIIDNKIVLELKAKSFILKEDYYQVNRYLQSSSHKLGLIVNFRNKYLKPIRVIRADS